MRWFVILFVGACGGKLDYSSYDRAPPGRFLCGARPPTEKETACVIGHEYCVVEYGARGALRPYVKGVECRPLPLPDGLTCSDPSQCQCSQEDGLACE